MLTASEVQKLTETAEKLNILSPIFLSMISGDFSEI